MPGGISVPRSDILEGNCLRRNLAFIVGIFWVWDFWVWDFWVWDFWDGVWGQ
jgi:hypothetical protein